MTNNERVRELCARVVNARGAAFDSAIMELADALESCQSEQDKDKKDEKAKEDTNGTLSP